MFRSNPVFLDESGPTLNTEEVLEKGRNLYRTNSNSSGYGSSSASQGMIIFWANSDLA